MSPRTRVLEDGHLLAALGCALVIALLRCWPELFDLVAPLLGVSLSVHAQEWRLALAALRSLTHR